MDAPAGPSRFWRLSERRSRKAASPNIFRGINLRQLQRLFRQSGDQQAEQRAQLIWGHSDEAELAQALIGLRGRSRRNRLRTEGTRDALGHKWLHAFGHLRINEGPARKNNEEDGEDSVNESTDSINANTATDSSCAGQEDVTLTDDRPPDPERLQLASSVWSRGGAMRQEGERDPERYLHRILH
ncbi:arginine vasopressin-induced protein 1 [Amia ocellicauda]|uniref:arginine vasopressin-induced protein 1 n=1 Tax=Amia ocellicauda TaxID=2972642 RepID=UPI003464480D